MSLTPLVWFIVGMGLLFVELVIPIPTLLVAGAMGLAAIAVAGLAYVLPVPALQVLAWMALSGLLVWYSRRLMPRDSRKLEDSREGIAIAEILPGEAGRVQFEGVSWRAICEVPHTTIGIGQRVVVVERRGTTLVVVPEQWLRDRAFSHEAAK